MTALANLSIEPSEGSNEPDVDCSYDELSGTYINSRLNAPNVWVTDVQPCLVAEAAAIFERAGLRAAFRRLSAAHEKSTETSCGEQVHCAEGERFFANHAGWNSDVGWLSADDQPTHDTFLSIFQRLGVGEKFRPIIGSAVHLYSAFFVVRSVCTAPDLHVDYGKKVKTTALTLMTPLYEEYSAVEDFQLIYKTLDKSIRRYRYRLGEAIVFGANFYHSTEPGVAALETSDEHEAVEAAEDAIPPLTAPSAPAVPPNPPERPVRRAHAYLCFTFGSNKEEAWKAISETVDGNQTRHISRPGQPNGGNNLSLSKLGLRIESGATGSDDTVSYGLGGKEPLGGKDSMGDDRLKEAPVPAPVPVVVLHPVEVEGDLGSASKRQVRRQPRGILK